MDIANVTRLNIYLLKNMAKCVSIGKLNVKRFGILKLLLFLIEFQ